MSDPRRRQRASSWLGTLVVTVAIIVIGLRAAASLRRSIATPAPGSEPPTPTRDAGP